MSISYRGQDLHNIEVRSVCEEVDLHFSAALKGIAVQRGELAPLACEEMLIESPAALTYVAQVDKAALVAQAAMRGELNRLTTDAGTSSSDDVLEVVRAHSAKLMLIDTNAKVELAILMELSGSACESRFISMITRALPSEHIRIKPEEAAQKLQAISVSPARKMAPRCVQEILKHVQSLVTSLCEDRPPDVRGALGNPKVQGIVALFQFFVHLTLKDGSVLFGTKAMEHILGDISKKRTAGKCTPHDVVPLATYAWLLGEKARGEALALIKEVKEKASEEIRRLSATTGHKRKASTAGSSGDSSMMAALEMFS